MGKQWGQCDRVVPLLLAILVLGRRRSLLCGIVRRQALISCRHNCPIIKTTPLSGVSPRLVRSALARGLQLDMIYSASRCYKVHINLAVSSILKNCKLILYLIKSGSAVYRGEGDRGDLYQTPVDRAMTPIARFS